MKIFGATAMMVFYVAALAGCVTNHDSSKRFVGKPLSEVAATMPKYGGYQERDQHGRPYFRWDFTETEMVSVQYGTTRQIPGGPSVSGGLAFENEERVRHCSVRAYFDPVTMITTDFRVERPGRAKCARMTSYLDGSAFLPTDFPG